MLAFIDRLSDRLGVISAWMFFAVGGMIAYEVTSRYIFNAPTIWAEEMSRFFQIWATYIAAATLLRHRELIRVTLVIERLGDMGRRVAEVFSLLVIACFSGIALWYGTLILLESIALNRSTSTMLDVPQWMTEIAIPIGFALLVLQCLAETVRMFAGWRDPGEGKSGIHPGEGM